MKISKRLVLLIILVGAISGTTVLYATPLFLRFSPASFPLGKLWSQRLKSTVVNISSSRDDSKILVRTGSALYALEPADGRIAWSSAVTKPIYDSPARSTAEMVFVTDNDSIQALNLNDGKLVWKQSLSQNNAVLVDLSESLVLVNQPSNDIRAYDTKSGELLWSVRVGRGIVSAYVDKGLVYIADDGIRAINSTTGEDVWQYGNNVIGESIYSDGTIYYTSGNKITAFNTQTQMELWSVNLPDNGFRRFKFDREFLIVMDHGNLYEFDKSNGTLVWQTDISYPTNPVVIGDSIYVLEGFSRIIRVFDLATKSEVGHLRISVPQLLVTDKQDMFSSGDTLLFSIGRNIFGYK